ncbi:hypothetical protein [Scytonema sp. UIC 10036]|uniref:hypothetical protein n=1 Tax=Scytonema sp. UIC 10036 TaxID=2304196 RepID=UPI001FAB0E65|nr:hypothetical protein [Scytonema sp. UIC 10036]
MKFMIGDRIKIARNKVGLSLRQLSEAIQGKVSPQAIGIISEATLTYSFQSIARYWRTTEPEELEVAEERGKKEQACRFERLCYRALAEGLISLSKAAELLRKPIHQVEAGLTGPSCVYSDYC